MLVLDDRRGIPVPDAGAADPRLVFTSVPRTEGVLDGGWWPHTRDLSEELPALLAAVASRFGAVARVSLSATVWDATPQEITACDRVVAVAWFRACDAHTIRLLGGQSWHLDLLVIPSDTAADTAATALALVATRHTIAALHAILTAPRQPHPASLPQAASPSRARTAEPARLSGERAGSKGRPVMRFRSFPEQADPPSNRARRDAT